MSYVVELISKPFIDLWNAITSSIINAFKYVHDVISDNICMFIYNMIETIERGLNVLRGMIPYAIGFLAMYEGLTHSIKVSGIRNKILSSIFSVIGSIVLTSIVDHITPVDVTLPKPTCRVISGICEEESDISVSSEEYFSEVWYA